MDKIVLKAMAKINLGLDVIRKRDDGYHEVRMVMQTVNLYDTLTFRRAGGGGIRLSADRAGVPLDERNLICKAASLLMESCGVRQGIEVRLEKRIPMAAGMAGGSTDAAAAFVGLNRLLGLGLNREQLCALGVKIGADVPYCIMGGTVLSEGIGEILTPLPPAPDCHLVIARPEIDVSTKYVYENLHADRLAYHPDIDGMVKAVRDQDRAGIVARMGNVLETVTVRRYPVIEEIKRFMKDNGAVNALMSGSGPTVFGIMENGKDAGELGQRLREASLAKDIFVTGFAQSCYDDMEDSYE